MNTDTIADLLTRLRNAQRAGHATVEIPVSKRVANILELLKTEGYISDFSKTRGNLLKKGRSPEIDKYLVNLKYGQDGTPAIRSISRLSKSGRRVYSPSARLPTIQCGLGIAMVSTSQGVMTDREARRRGIGGELLASVF